MSVRRAQTEIDGLEFAEWRAWLSLEPTGDQRADWHAALIAWAIATAMRGKKSRRLHVHDFLLKFVPRDRKPKTDAELRDALLAMAKMHNAALELK